MKIYKTLFVSLVLFLSGSIYGLIPLDTILLGNIEDKYDVEKIDPLDSIFIKNKGKLEAGELNHRKEMALYRGIFEEGQNTVNYCKMAEKIRYGNYWDKSQSKRSIVATLQYVGLDIVTRALASYAKKLDFSEDEYDNLTQNLTQNFCSPNMSIISIPELASNMSIQFKSKSSYSLPSFKNNPLFPQYLLQMSHQDKITEREFLYTVKLFKSFCSWGNDATNLRLLVPLVRNAAVMSFVARQLGGQSINWDRTENRLYLEKDNKTVQVLCDGYLCRKVSKLDFDEKYVSALGSLNISDDVKRLYCDDFRDAHYSVFEQDKKILKLIKGRSLTDEKIMVSQFLSLVAGVPDLLVGSERFANAKSLVIKALESVWSKWAALSLANNKKTLAFEESLTVELVDRKYYFNSSIRKFQVEFDVNLGELDRVNQLVGKIRTSFDLNISKKFLFWIKKEWAKRTVDRVEHTKALKRRMAIIVAKELNKSQHKMKLNIWNKGPEDLIVDELLFQIENFKGHYYKITDTGNETIKIGLNYAPFALKYIRNKYLINKKLQEINPPNNKDQAKINPILTKPLR